MLPVFRHPQVSFACSHPTSLISASLEWLTTLTCFQILPPYPFSTPTDTYLSFRWKISTMRTGSTLIPLMSMRKTIRSPPFKATLRPCLPFGCRHLVPRFIGQLAFSSGPLYRAWNIQLEGCKKVDARSIRLGHLDDAYITLAKRCPFQAHHCPVKNPILTSVIPAFTTNRHPRSVSAL